VIRAHFSQKETPLACFWGFFSLSIHSQEAIRVEMRLLQILLFHEMNKRQD
jgi:hypothetical protein